MIAMLAADPLGRQREDPSLPLASSYERSFAAIDQDPNHELMTVWKPGDPPQLVGMFQLSFLPYLTYCGGWRALLEGVRVHADCRGQGIGKAMVQWAVWRARQRKCHMLQLTTDKQRPQALAFYRQLGFQASHEGLKMTL